MTISWKYHLTLQSGFPGKGKPSGFSVLVWVWLGNLLLAKSQGNSKSLCHFPSIEEALIEERKKKRWLWNKYTDKYAKQKKHIFVHENYLKKNSLTTIECSVCNILSFFWFNLLVEIGVVYVVLIKYNFVKYKDYFLNKDE